MSLVTPSSTALAQRPAVAIVAVIATDHGLDCVSRQVVCIDCTAGGHDDDYPLYQLPTALAPPSGAVG